MNLLGAVSVGGATHGVVQRGLVMGTLCRSHSFNSTVRMPMIVIDGITCGKCLAFKHAELVPIKRGRNRQWWPGAGRGRQLSVTGTRQNPEIGGKAIGRTQDFRHAGRSKDALTAPMRSVRS